MVASVYGDRKHFYCQFGTIKKHACKITMKTKMTFWENAYTSVDQNIIISSSYDKLKVKLPSWKVIDHLNLSCPVLAELFFFSDKNRSFNLDLVYFYSEFFPFFPFSILLIYFKRATTVLLFFNLNENKLLCWSEEARLIEYHCVALFDVSWK